jgi:hypothetical protein
MMFEAVSTRSARVAAALTNAGVVLPAKSDLDRHERGISRAVLTFAAREGAAKSSPTKKADWALSVKKHAIALAEELRQAGAATRCAHEAEIARLRPRRGARYLASRLLCVYAVGLGQRGRRHAPGLRGGRTKGAQENRGA